MNETYIGYAISIPFIKLMKEIYPKPIKIDPKIFTNSEEDSDYDVDELYEKLDRHLKRNLIWGLRLSILRKRHVESQDICFFGIFIPLNNEFGLENITDNKFEQIKNLYNEIFKTKCEALFELTPQVCSVTCGCYCCT
jgi:hypothetical protein